MKTIVYFECEICKQRYTDAQHAVMCEARGFAEEYPRGLIFGSTRGFYKDTFVIAKNCLNGHSNSPALWAFRDTSAGDSLSLKDTFRSNNSTQLRTEDGANREHPTFKRAVRFLKRHNIVPLVWNGKTIEKL